MSLTVLNVAFPFARLTADPVGGAEQVLAHIDRMLVDHGHRSLVIAAEGSRVAGELIPIRLPDRTLNEALRRRTQAAVRVAVARSSAQVDLVHLHGSDFFTYRPPAQVPTLVTLHMPLSWYPAGALREAGRHIFFNPVSTAQAQKASPGLHLLEPIGNGVKVNTFAGAPAPKGRFALALGRICREKGFHCAIEASIRARVPLYLAGTVYPWPEHQRYFAQQIVPRLDPDRCWIGPIGGNFKRSLLRRARCVLIPSLVEETSSLVAMEALASGTPVIAFRAGALPDIVEHGVTGYVVSNTAEMAEALHLVDRIDPQVCRDVARRRFDLQLSMTQYLQLYYGIAARNIQPTVARPQTPLPSAACSA